VKKLYPLLILVIALVFTVSCVSKEVPVTETYYETEYRTETYTEVEKVAVDTKERLINLTPVKEYTVGGVTYSSGGYGIGTLYARYYEIAPYSCRQGKVVIQVSTAGGYIEVYDTTNPIYVLNLVNTTTMVRETLYSHSMSEPEISFDVKDIEKFIILANTLNKNAIKSVNLVCPTQITEEKTVTKERQVSYQVEKQRTVMQTQKLPFWEAIFD
jgi:hypothetical protein